MTDLQLKQLAKNYIAGEWLYSASEKILKKNFADDAQLKKLNLIDEEGFLNEQLREQIEIELGDEILAHVEGPFGDDDIFSGDILDDIIRYNIELHSISEATMDALQKIPNVTIKIID